MEAVLGTILPNFFILLIEELILWGWGNICGLFNSLWQSWDQNLMDPGFLAFHLHDAMFFSAPSTPEYTGLFFYWSLQ